MREYFAIKNKKKKIRKRKSQEVRGSKRLFYREMTRMTMPLGINKEIKVNWQILKWCSTRRIFLSLSLSLNIYKAAFI
tara:strand:- start:297 stop:530 length:234 start_codon:yes stop_codon:yes gene_type:complete